MRSRAEEPHQVVFERQEELRRARIALTARAAAQLPVDAPRLVALGADDVQAADLHRRRSILSSGSLTCDGFDSVTPAPSLMSVPRPAMFVAIVTAPGWPAPATISASRWWYFAFSTLCVKPARLNMRDSVSDTSTLTVPTSTG